MGNNPIIIKNAGGRSVVFNQAPGRFGAQTGDYTAPASTSTLLFEETFVNTNLSSRGWYDLGGATINTTEHPAGINQSMEFKWTSGNTRPSGSVSGRMLFTPSDSVYLSYWIKHSSNWVGSGQTYHPHYFHFVTNLDDEFVGPAVTHMTTYIEDNFQSEGGYAVLAAQDASNINTGSINTDLTSVTENRAVCGCNGTGGGDGTSDSCFQDGTTWVNAKTWKSSSPVFSQSAGATYKADWHKVEAYFQMNSIVGGVGQFDGIVQYLVDGVSVINKTNIILRTGQHSDMKFNQFLMAPYIGDGSPANQSVYIADIIVRTGFP